MKRHPAAARISRTNVVLGGARNLVAAMIIFAAGAGALAGTADEDWQAVVALDAGPGGQPNTVESAGLLVVNHLAKQEKALRAFLAAIDKSLSTACGSQARAAARPPANFSMSSSEMS